MKRMSVLSALIALVVLAPQPANAAPPAPISAYLQTTCQPGVAGDCVRAITVSNPDGSNIGSSSGSSPSTPTYTTQVAGSQPTPATATSGQLTGTPIDLQLASGAQFQIAGLNADSLAITQGMGPNCATATYVTATVLKHDLTTTAATALTGTAANGIYSVMVFGGCLKITRTGSADTLTVTYRGTN